MPIIKPDLKDVNKPIDPGTYPAEILSVEFKTSGAGNPMIVPKFAIQVGERTYYRNAYLVIVGSAAFGFESLLRACHFHDAANAMKSDNVPDFDTDQLVGQKCSVVVDSDVYQGAIIDRVKSFLPL